MDFRSITQKFQHLVIENSNTTLTAIGVAGVVVTSFLTAKGTFKAAAKLQEENLDELTTKEVVELVWTDYVPAVSAGLVTCAAIIFADRIGSRRAAALAAAYTITDRAFVDYRDKIIAKIGPKQEEVIRSEIARDRIERSKTEVVISSGGDVLCYDSFTGRTFMSDMETLRKAENRINHDLLTDMYASLSDFYDLVGLPHTSYSDEVGWNADRLLELRFSAVLCDGDRPCINIEFNVTPVKHFNHLG
jgi:hypothetical protein